MQEAATCAFYYLANESLSAQESILWRSHLGAEADIPKKGKYGSVQTSFPCLGGVVEAVRAIQISKRGSVKS